MKPTDSIPDDAVVLGRLGKTHGLTGELRFYPFGCTQELLRRYDRVLANDRELQLTGCRGDPAADFWLVRIEGVSDRETARKMTGLHLCVPQDALPKLPEMEFYEADLIGALVQNDEGEPLGAIQEVMPLPEHDVLVIRDEAGRERLIPTLRDILREWDAEARRLTVHWRDWEEETEIHGGSDES